MAGVDTGVVGEEGVEAVVAGDIQEPVCTALAHAREVGDGDREEVEHVAERRPVEVSVRLEAAIQCHDGVVDRARELALGDGRGVGDRVPHRTVHLRRAAQGVGILNPCETLRPADHGRTGEHRAHVGGGVGLPRMRT